MSHENNYIDDEPISKNLSDDNKIAYLNTTNDEEAERTKVICSLTYDEDKKEYLKTINTDFYRAQIIASLTSDHDKKLLIQTLKDIKDKAYVMSSFSNDKYKKTCLRMIRNENAQTIIIASLDNDEDKKEYLKTIKNPALRCNIICSFSSDDYKKEYLTDITDQRQRTDIICSLINSSDRKELLETITDSACRVAIICSLPPKDREELLPTVKDKMHQAIIRSTMESELATSHQDSLTKEEPDNTSDQASTDTSTKLEDLSIEELEKNITDLNTKIESNQHAIDNLQRRKRLIAEICSKREIVSTQQNLLATLQEEINEILSKNTQYQEH